MLLKIRNRHIFVIDALLLGAIALSGIALQFEGFHWPSEARQRLVTGLIASLPLKLTIFWLFGLYRGLWRYASLSELERIFVAGAVAAIASITLGAVVFPAIGLTVGRAPFAVLAYSAMGTIAVPAMSRLAIRFASAHLARRMGPRPDLRRAVVVGAGVAGQAILRESLSSHHANFAVVAFVDDDPAKRGLMLGGVKVDGALADIAQVIKRHQADEVIIAISAARGALVRLIVENAKSAGATTRIVPTLGDILYGNISVSKLRKVEIADLLRRESVRTDFARVRALAEGKTVLVTGAGGSIGSELCRQLAGLNPSRLVVLDHSENAVFTISGELRKRFPDLVIASVVADIRNALRIRHTFEQYQPFAVFHAAAHKHVPLMEENVHAAVNNNVLGTRNVVDAALDNDVAHFVLISTDKAVRPTSIMGATKRLAEHIVHHAACKEKRNFVSVRFGNVLGSSGSVIPTFLEQIGNGGPVTVTHPDMVRYFMTIPEAVQLVLQAGAIGKGGELFVLDMGNPVRIADLAKDLIRLSGFDENEIEIVFSGVRPGEKLFEELFLAEEDVTGTEHPKILRARTEPLDPILVQRLDALAQSVLGTADDKVLRDLLHVLVPDFSRTDARSPMAPLTPPPPITRLRQTGS